jgi:N-methylhydantoinase A/oxoprolinase/acetone carboxylase beta subunit
VTVRLGVDVGGTFTKAVAVDAATGELVAQAIVPTSHAAVDGIAEGVVASIAAARLRVDAAGAGPIAMVGHSTSLAVNALLEGDLPVIGLIGIGRAPDLGVARKRTDVGAIELAPGRLLRPIYRFVDVTGGLAAERVEAVLDDLVASGAAAIAVSEAFSVDDPTAERAFLEAAAKRGLPACAGHELTGLLGLELRTVSSVVNAAILPRARATADVVSTGLARAGIDAPLVILRGDGGATDLEGFAAMPLRSLFSGPAASLAGVLHSTAVNDAVVLEVGGTSTNVSIVRGGRPRLAYVRVGNQATCLRSVDVWVAGVAGGSMARIGRGKVTAVGPRSAHIAGLPYAAYSPVAAMGSGTPVLIAPLAGDLDDHLALDTEAGRVALTSTCAANALGRVAPGSYADATSDAAARAFESAARGLGMNGRKLAEAVLTTAAGELVQTLRATARAAGLDLRRIPLIGVGGGAGALVPAVAALTGQTWELAPHAEVLSSIGAAASLIQAVAERSAIEVDPRLLADAVDEAERMAIAAGAAPTSVETRTEYDAQRRTVRAVATGSLPLQADLDAHRPDLSPAELQGRAAGYLGLAASAVEERGATDHYLAFAGPERRGERAWVLVDRRGALAHAGTAMTTMAGPAESIRTGFDASVRRYERHIGPTSIAPSVLAVVGRRLIDCSALTSVAAVVTAVDEALARGSGERAIVAIERERRD